MSRSQPCHVLTASLVALALLSGSAAPAAVTSQVATTTIEAGGFASFSASECPPGAFIASGGADAANAATDSLTYTAPSFTTGGLGTKAPGSYPAEKFWSGGSQNDGQAAHAFAVSAVCISGGRTVEVENLDAPGAGGWAQRVLCPSGGTALGGGASQGNDTVITSSGPVLDDGTADGLRILNQPDGPGARPIGWRSSVRKPSAGDIVLRAAAVCQSLGIDATTMVASSPLTAGGTGTARAFCPQGTVALGGGVDDDQDFDVVITSSSPLFDDGTADGQRTINRPYGPDVAPIGWFGAARNEGAAGHTLKVAVICPEPARSEVAVGATLALLARFAITRRRRERPVHPGSVATRRSAGSALPIRSAKLSQ